MAKTYSFEIATNAVRGIIKVGDNEYIDRDLTIAQRSRIWTKYVKDNDTSGIVENALEILADHLNDTRVDKTKGEVSQDSLQALMTTDEFRKLLARVLPSLFGG
jgi:hypothetical protein